MKLLTDDYYDNAVNDTAILLKYIDDYFLWRRILLMMNITVADKATHWTQKKFKLLNIHELLWMKQWNKTAILLKYIDE